MLSGIVAFLNIPEVFNQLQDNYKHWIDLEEQQRSDSTSNK